MSLSYICQIDFVLESYGAHGPKGPGPGPGVAPTIYEINMRNTFLPVPWLYPGWLGWLGWRVLIQGGFQLGAPGFQVTSHRFPIRLQVVSDWSFAGFRLVRLVSAWGVPIGLPGFRLGISDWRRYHVLRGGIIVMVDRSGPSCAELIQCGHTPEGWQTAAVANF